MALPPYLCMKGQGIRRFTERLRMWKEVWLGACRKRSGSGSEPWMRRMIKTRIPQQFSHRVRFFGFWAAFIQSTGKVCPKAVFLIVHNPKVRHWGLHLLYKGAEAKALRPKLANQQMDKDTGSKPPVPLVF